MIQAQQACGREDTGNHLNFLEDEELDRNLIDDESS